MFWFWVIWAGFVVVLFIGFFVSFVDDLKQGSEQD